MNFPEPSFDGINDRQPVSESVSKEAVIKAVFIQSSFFMDCLPMVQILPLRFHTTWTPVALGNMVAVKNMGAVVIFHLLLRWFSGVRHPLQNRAQPLSIGPHFASPFRPTAMTSPSDFTSSSPPAGQNPAPPQQGQPSDRSGLWIRRSRS